MAPPAQMRSGHRFTLAERDPRMAEPSPAIRRRCRLVQTPLPDLRDGSHMMGTVVASLRKRLLHVGRWLVRKPARLAGAVVLVLVIVISLRLIAGGRSNPTGVDSSHGSPSASAFPGSSPPVGDGSASSSGEPADPSPPHSASDDDMDTPFAPAVWDTESRSSALSTGVAVVSAFLSGDQTALDALLAPGTAIKAQRDTRGISLTPTRPPGQPGPYLQSELSAYTTVVMVPSTAGTWAVSIVRADGKSPWLCIGLDVP